MMSILSGNNSELAATSRHFSLTNYFVFISMLIVCSGIGIYFGFLEKRKQKSKELKQQYHEKITTTVIRNKSETLALDYLVGGRKMKVFPVAMSLISSYVSGISLLGVPTEIYIYGTQYAFNLISLALSSIASFYIFLPVFHNLQITSTYEYLEMRFDKKVRLLGSVLFTIETILWLPIVIYVPALAFNQVTGINIHVITPIVCSICIFYTCVGGVKAVVWTDVVQSFTMLGSIILIMIKGTRDLGGIDIVLDRNSKSDRLVAPDLTLDLTVRLSVWSIFIGGFVDWTQTSAGSQVVMQRFLSLPTLADARKALIIFITGVIILLGCCMYNGLLIYATYYNCDPLTTKIVKEKDQLLPLLVMDTLGVFPGLPGIFLAGVFSAALSTLSTGLNSLAAVILEDFFKPNVKKPLSTKQISIIMRMIVILCGMLCVSLVLIVEKLDMVLQMTTTIGAITCGPLFGLFITGLCIPWINGKSVMAGAICTFFVMAWICIKAETEIASGQLKFPQKPLSVEGCYTNSSVKSSTMFTNSAINNNQDLVKEIYHMSFLLYTTAATLLTITIASISSLVFGTVNSADMDENLIAPIMRKFIKPKRIYLSVKRDPSDETETVT